MKSHTFSHREKHDPAGFKIQYDLSSTEQCFPADYSAAQTLAPSSQQKHRGQPVTTLAPTQYAPA